MSSLEGDVNVGIEAIFLLLLLSSCSIFIFFIIFLFFLFSSLNSSLKYLGEFEVPTTSGEGIGG
uniref:Candidate secreted effector n=1 Tax=Meloidogyne incognita TaxID=6306 RepID=A0A914KL70_MELIC